MSKYLLDTDWIIHYLRGNKEVIEQINSFANDGIAVSIISVAELYEGVYSSKSTDNQRKSLENFLKSVKIIKINKEIAETFGKTRAELRKQGNLIDNFDILIASTCLIYDLELITGNYKHFQRIQNLKLKVT